MKFSSSSSLKDCQFVGAPIVFAKDHNDLGLYIADILNWDAHVEAKCSKANKVFFMMKRSSPHISVKSKLNLYKTMVLPIMMYASCCCHASVRSMRNLEAVQKRVTRWILPHCENYKERLLFLNLLPVSLYLQLRDLLMLSKLIAGCFDFDSSARMSYRMNFRQNKLEFIVERSPRLSKVDTNFWCREPRLVNKLPTAIDFFNPIGLKGRLNSFLWCFFSEKYNQKVSCSWKLPCDCTMNGCRFSVNLYLG